MALLGVFGLLIFLLGLFADAVQATASAAHSSRGRRPSGRPLPGGFSPVIPIPGDFRRMPAPETEPVFSEPSDDSDEPSRNVSPPRIRTSRSRALEERRNHPETMGSVEALEFLLESATDMDPGLPREVLNDPKGALRKYSRQVRAMGRKPGAKMVATNRLGHVYYLLGLFDAARENYELALSLADKDGNDKARALLTNNIGIVYRARGNAAEARMKYREALDRFRKQGDAAGIGMTLMNLGVLAKDQGRFKLAVEQLEESVKAGDSSGLLGALKLENMGKLYARWGESHQAEKCYKDAVAILGKMGEKKRVADNLAKLGELYAAGGEVTAAEETFKEALATSEKAGEKPYRIYQLMGGLYLDAGDAGKAREFVEKGKYNSQLGRLHLMEKDWKKAETDYRNLLKTARKYNRTEDLFTAHTGLARASEARNLPKEAEEHYVVAMDVSEEIRAGLLLSERRTFSSTRINGFLPSDPAKGVVRVRFNTERWGTDIYESELTRARDFADKIAQRADGTKLEVPQSILGKEEELFNRLAALTKARSLLPREKDSRRYDAISKEIHKTEEEIKQFSAMLDNRYPRYASVRRPHPVKLKDAAIRPDEYIILFDIFDRGVGTRVIKGKKIVYGTYRKWDSTELQETVKRFRAPLANARLNEFEETLGKKLYSGLFGAALEKIPAGAAIIIVPDGILGLLPFEALVVEGKPVWKESRWGPYPDGLTYLFDRHPVIYQQSVTALTLERTLPRKERSGDSLLVIADPVFGADDARAAKAGPENTSYGDKSFFKGLMSALGRDGDKGFKVERLATTGEMAQSLKSLYGDQCELYTGLQADKELFLRKVAPELTRFRWMVFATHGFADENAPGIMEPFLLLSLVPEGRDGFLKMTDVLGLEIAADLVAVTACQSGFGRYVSGEGIMSLGRAFQCAGAKASLVSLWSVAEISSVSLVERFFSHLKEGKDKAIAWHAARKELREAGFEHPFFWASFVMVGQPE